MTRGPIAMFFGGNDALKGLSERKTGSHVQFFFLVSLVFNVSILSTVK